MSVHDIHALNKHRGKFVEAGKQTGIEPSLIAAIASRESNGGLTLKSNGYGNDGHGYGIMQVDDRSHKPVGGPYSQQNITQGAQILKQCKTDVAKDHPTWPADKKHQGSIACYNFGRGNVRNMDKIDVGSKGHNYSSEVMKRQQFLKKNGF